MMAVLEIRCDVCGDFARRVGRGLLCEDCELATRRLRRTVEFARETDGSRPCVPYPGWRVIGERLAARKKIGGGR